ncbi:hypothetical protein BHE74_00004916 [Ensete ventricosum]|nr:hypothetical protein GW17_00007644 [Ensete ventricosum]RWW86327.1 hypothetical protein BHE74_00004916 [Ensete ventricosum]RZR82726.1 hypothetical protein BHM03_00009215 [Ensete ventricosum]
MHIKKVDDTSRVIIEGFKSYKEEVSTDPFSPKVNCVGNAFSQLLHQVDRDEVRLRRTISLKKDEYFLDGKHVTYVSLMLHFIMEREKQLSILYQKQGRATQFASKAARDKWLQREIDDLERVLSSNVLQYFVCSLEVIMFLPSVCLWKWLCFRSLWNEEANLSAEIDKLRSELIKAQKSLDHATPGVSKNLKPVL